MTVTVKRSFLFLLTGILCAVGLLAQAETKKGYLSFSVKVTEDNAPLYSSPGGENAYITGYIKSGDLLEVFLRTPDGWCAVRPPEGSFSWINADYVLQTGSDMGTIVSPDPSKEVPVRVGAASILKSSDVQVGLENGRQVRILGEQTLTGNKTWLKIAPPRGEFRWIRAASLEQDEFLANIPDRLTRYEEMLAQNGNAVTPSSFPEELSPETMNRLDEEKLIPGTGLQNDTIRNVSFESTFNRELARLYRDLLTAVESTEPTPIYDDLARRASALESFASDDIQRSEARKLVTQIEERRIAAVNPRGGIITNQSTGLVDARPIYQAPVSGKASDSEQVLFTVPQSAASPSVTGGAASTSNTAAQPSNKVRFAFAPRSQQSTNNQVSEKRGIFTPKPSTIVPPANYTYPAPTLLKVAPQPSSSDAAPPAQTPATPQQNSPQNQSSEPNKVFLAQNEPNQEIRQVSALFVKPTIEPSPQQSVSSVTAQTPVSAVSLPVNTPQSIPGASSPEVSGILGFLPNSRDGVPSYALISKTGNQNSILCYVVPQQGKTLDPYVGKKIAITGTRSWFKKGEENRKMIVAESIRIF